MLDVAKSKGIYGELLCAYVALGDEKLAIPDSELGTEMMNNIELSPLSDSVSLYLCVCISLSACWSLSHPVSFSNLADDEEIFNGSCKSLT